MGYFGYSRERGESIGWMGAETWVSLAWRKRVRRFVGLIGSSAECGVAAQTNPEKEAESRFATHGRFSRKKEIVGNI